MTILTHDHADKIVNAINAVHQMDSHGFVPFQTDRARGYIPRSHLESYIDTGLFEYDADAETLSFAGNVRGFDAKSEAMNIVTEKLIENGLIERSTEPHFQERAVGDDDRLNDPEFKINRAYYRHYGFMADGVMLNVITAGDDPQILLQVRSGRVENASTYDFAAGGAIKYPQKLTDALHLQALEETGLELSSPPVLATRSYIGYAEAEKGWTTRICHSLFTATVPEIMLGDYNPEEVEGFELLSPAEAVQACADGRFNKMNVQSFMIALDRAGLMPEFPGVEKIREAIKPHSYNPERDMAASLAQAAPPAP